MEQLDFNYIDTAGKFTRTEEEVASGARPCKAVIVVEQDTIRDGLLINLKGLKQEQRDELKSLIASKLESFGGGEMQVVKDLPTTITSIEMHTSVKRAQPHTKAASMKYLDFSAVIREAKGRAARFFKGHKVVSIFNRYANK